LKASAQQSADAADNDIVQSPGRDRNDAGTALNASQARIGKGEFIANGRNNANSSSAEQRRWTRKRSPRP
jgi:hypothetical protein